MLLSLSFNYMNSITSTLIESNRLVKADLVAEYEDFNPKLILAAIFYINTI